MSRLRDEAEAELRRLVGSGARFRPDQYEAVEALVEGRRRVLVVQRTGWGKSAVYFVATKLLRDRGAGPTLLVSPLLGLMRDQIDAGERGGVRAARIASDNTEEWDRVNEALRRDEIDILLVSPERFANRRFREDELPLVTRRSGLFVIDEAHCISDWGHDFRPDYRRLSRIVDLMPSGIPVLCTTATANDRVVGDIVEQLGDDIVVLRGPLDRESLALDILHLPTPAQRLAWLAKTLPQLDGTGIVYTLTVGDAHRVSSWLRTRGIEARAYTGEDPTEAKLEIEAQLQQNEIKCVVATSALGMGYDKPDLSFVIHFQVPGSAIAYYQQVGRAGRAIERAYAIGLAGAEDRQIQDWFINTAFPAAEHAERVVALLTERGDWVKLVELEEHVNLRRTRLLNMMKILEVEGAVECDGLKWRRTLAPWTYPRERVLAVTAQRRDEQARMREFLDGDGCLMEFLRRELDDPGATRCGRCGRCLGRPLLPADVDRAVALDALAFLRQQWIIVEPRAKWPDLKNIPVAERNEPGRALSLYGDGGWGTLVKEQKGDGNYADELVAALADLVAGWVPDPAPTWATCVPSLRDPELVPSLARRVADQLGLPFTPVVSKVRETPAQKDMDNSPQQYRNVAEAFTVTAPVPAGPVLLIDDIVDSRWTLTVIGAQLRQTGSGPVFPLVLAQAKGG